MSEIFKEPYGKLAAAVLARAGLEARRGNGDALKWLVSEDGLTYAQALGLDRASIIKFVDAVEAHQKRNSETMNNYLKRHGRPPNPEPIETVMTDDQAERIEFYMLKGATYREARSLVLGLPESEPEPIPTGGAGDGTGKTQYPKQLSMSEFIRALAGK